VTAERLFARVTEIDPDEAAGWMGRAEATRLLGDSETAFRFAREGVLRWGTSPHYLMEFGTIAASLANYDLADQCYRHALAIDPKFEPARRGLDVLQALRKGEVSRLPPAGGG
jgi:tetratricopeptide (TPR) repeat protein